ncbi:MAG: uracil-DNA glycosylase [Herminiimonas sp.]|nr:uracil-DNA glycosylase [Herminiimonas sp.]
MWCQLPKAESPPVATDSPVPDAIAALVRVAHPSWHAILARGLQGVADADPGYLPGLLKAPYLPTAGRLFAAFAQPLAAVRYVLVGEGPYPRAASATGVCFMDGAVGSLWAPTGLSKQVNRATSLRNFMKMLLVTEGRLHPERTSGDALMSIGSAAVTGSCGSIGSLAQLQDNLLRHGFLLLNAALAFRPDVPPIREARGWQPFLRSVLAALAQYAEAAGQAPPTLVLWGKIAAQVDTLPESAGFPKAVAEHPYNLSFIGNQEMQALFGPMHLLAVASPASVAGAVQAASMINSLVK